MNRGTANVIFYTMCAIAALALVFVISKGIERANERDALYERLKTSYVNTVKTAGKWL